MKKLILFIALILNCRAQSQESKMFFLPFEKVNVSAELLKVTASLVIPPLVSQENFTEFVKKDCSQFKETMNRFQGQLKPEDLKDFLTMPLGYTMKRDYQIKVIFDRDTVYNISDSLKLRFDGLASLKLGLEIGDESLTGKTQSPTVFGLTPELTQQFSNYEIKFNSRDQFCDYIDGHLALKLKFNASVQNTESNDVKKNFQQLAVAVDSLSALNAKEKAVKTGLLMQVFFDENDQSIDSEFRNYDYLWKLLFSNENSFDKTSFWNEYGPGISFDQFFSQDAQELNVVIAL
ncbi:MAG: hypothetical protein ACXVAX_05475 [Pseudobdellovibrio sp.]